MIGTALSLLVALSGCQSGNSGAREVAVTPTWAAPIARLSIALPSETALEGLSLAAGEGSRRDALVSPVAPPTLLATTQWPQEAKPIERPVRFTRWQQR